MTKYIILTALLIASISIKSQDIEMKVQDELQVNQTYLIKKSKRPKYFERRADWIS